MHDFFDIVGLSHSAPPVEVRRACARLIRRAHPDFQPSGNEPTRARVAPALTAASLSRETAVEFLDMSAVIDRMQTAFFRDDSAASADRQ